MSYQEHLDQIEALVKRANLRARLYVARRGEVRALRALAARGRLVWVGPTRTSLGGWVWVPAPKARPRNEINSRLSRGARPMKA